MDVKIVHPVYSAGNWTHDLQNMSLLPQPLDQGSRPRLQYLIHWFLMHLFEQSIFSQHTIDSTLISFLEVQFALNIFYQFSLFLNL